MAQWVKIATHLSRIVQVKEVYYVVQYLLTKSGCHHTVSPGLTAGTEIRCPWMRGCHLAEM